MKNINQKEINTTVLEHMTAALAELETCRQMPSFGVGDWHRLRTCKAEWAVTGHYIILRSYNTIVACIKTSEWICYDFSRYAYGYTATTNQHIRKFAVDHNAEIFAYRE